ncbi:M20/M25/M40 family metallo-hydrolase [Luteitalea sp. TBR-22]|uniref:M20/M25/M40 family metallo-hydrolase n=1 Tax=Luteitalea sp. TBR-22 TaxID=2802971 RepID=UPI001EF46AAB|nr:M20/M25/M40 family metallo-hydrolase [Luteitalea sp. TBR-22]
MALLGLIQGLIFNDLANTLSDHLRVWTPWRWLVVAHLALCFAILLRVIQTYITAALYYRKQLNLSEIVILSVIGVLQHLLVQSIRSPSVEADVLDVSFFYKSLLLVVFLGCVAYLLTLRGLLVAYRALPVPQSPPELKRSVVLQVINLTGMACIGVLALLALSGTVPPIVSASLCSAILVANTAYSSRQSFVQHTVATATARTDVLAVARSLSREFDYVFGRFLPGDIERRARIIALAICFFEDGHLLGRARLVTLTDDDEAFAFVAPPDQGRLTGARSVAAFAIATACCGVSKVPSTLWRAWRNRALLFAVTTSAPAWKVLYLVVPDTRRRQGLGVALLRRVEALAGRSATPRIGAAVRTRNVAARKMFLSRGYRKVSKHREVIPGEEHRGGLAVYQMAVPSQSTPAATQGSFAAVPSAGRRGWLAAVALGVAVLLAGVVLSARAFRVASRQPPALPTEGLLPAPPRADLAATLAASIRFRTISHGAAPDALTDQALVEFVSFLTRTYPAMRFERVGPRAHLVTIPGQDHSLPGALVYAHLDVVPADTKGWKQDPFGGVVSDGYVHGRGALDDKFSVIAILAATQELLGAGWAPTRPMYIALGHDEELDGTGAQAVAAHLRERGLRVGSVLDEGSAVVEGVLPGLDGPVAAVAIAEKGYLDVTLCAVGTPGHSSSPPVSTAIGAISTAVHRLEQNPPPTALNALMAQTLTYAAAEMSYPWRLVVSNLWLTTPLIEASMRGAPLSRALLGSSQSATLVAGGTKANVLPERACATLNYRLLPGSSPEDMLRRVRSVVGDSRVSVTHGPPGPAPTVSDLDSPAGIRLGQVIRRHFPRAVVVPVLSPGTTDSRHFGQVADQIFRFSPLELSDEELASLHGTNERIRVLALEKAYAFYHSYLQHASRK